jgi:16S rRNA (adenine1518-N6/adenine1519-N6)-dimethyltransferase
VSVADLPPLRETLAAQGLLAKKSFGQHFLLDLNITRKIARIAGPLAGCAVLEIGPGPGGLTRALLESDAAHIIAVEKDRRFIDLLQELAEVAPGRLTVVEADALDIDEADLLASHAPGLPSRVIANLPYNVGTPLLIKWLTGPYQPDSMTLMFQREVAERIAAPVKDEAYGRLAVICQLLADTSVVMNLPPQAFTPPPRVHSAVVRLDLRADRPTGKRLAKLEDVTRHAFGQRRKMLRSSLKGMGGETLCERAGVDAGLRAEDVPIDGFLRLADSAL